MTILVLSLFEGQTCHTRSLNELNQNTFILYQQVIMFCNNSVSLSTQQQEKYTKGQGII